MGRFKAIIGRGTSLSGCESFSKSKARDCRHGAQSFSHASGDFGDNDYFLAVKTNSDGGNNTDTITVTLPNPATRTGKTYLIKDISGGANTNKIQIASSNGTVEPNEAGSTMIQSSNGALSVIAANNNWHIF